MTDQATAAIEAMNKPPSESKKFIAWGAACTAIVGIGVLAIWKDSAPSIVELIFTHIVYLTGGYLGILGLKEGWVRGKAVEHPPKEGTP